MGNFTVLKMCLIVHEQKDCWTVQNTRPMCDTKNGFKTANKKG